MRKRLVGVFVVSSVALMAVAGTAAAGGGNSGAAQSCQQGGYLTMQRSDGTSFKNAGDCVSYFAQTNKTAACVVTATTGCMTFDNVILTNGSGDTVTLNAAYSFDTTCTDLCPDDVYLNNYATGGGTYTIRSSSGGIIEQSTLTTADTPGTTYEGLYQAIYLDSSEHTSTCTAAASRLVDVYANTGVATDQVAVLHGVYVPAQPSSSDVQFTTDNFAFSGDPAGFTIAC
jgi:hypothetical protein